MLSYALSVNKHFIHINQDTIVQSLDKKLSSDNINDFFVEHI